MKRIFLYTLGGLFLMNGCKKADAPTTTPDTNIGYISFTNVNSSSKSLNIYIDQKLVNPTALGVNATLTGIYAGITEGARTLLTRDIATTLPPIDYFSANINVTKGASYSFFQYGVLTGGSLKGIVLNTDRKPDANAENARVRFLNISNGAPALDLVMVRSEGAVAKDSLVLYAAVPSLLSVASPDVNALSPHKSVAGNKAAGFTTGSLVSTYVFRLKLAGTNTIISSTGATTITPGRNYTYYARGTYPAAALSVLLDN